MISAIQVMIISILSHSRFLFIAECITTATFAVIKGLSTSVWGIWMAWLRGPRMPVWPGDTNIPCKDQHFCHTSWVRARFSVDVVGKNDYKPRWHCDIFKAGLHQVLEVCAHIVKRENLYALHRRYFIIFIEVDGCINFWAVWIDARLKACFVNIKKCNIPKRYLKMSQSMQLQAKKPTVKLDRHRIFSMRRWTGRGRQLRCVRLAWPTSE